MYDIIIIGSGIAGMTAAIYGARAGKKVAIIESSYYGGQIISSSIVENYPAFTSISGAELGNLIYNQMQSLNIEYITDRVLKIDGHLVIAQNNNYLTKTIIIATGMMRRKLELDNIDKLDGRGISYCATCDGNFYRNKVVAVVGGGNTALEDAFYLSSICKKVYLIHRKSEFTGEIIYQERLKKCNNVEFIMEEEVIGLYGSDQLEKVQLKKQLLSVSGLFVAIGNIPNTSMFRDLIVCDKNGYIISDDTTTNIDYIFVAGDVRTKKVRQLVTAAADGAIAVYNALEFIKNGE